MSVRPYEQCLRELHTKFNHRGFVHPDPLEFLYDYEDVRDREIVALVASSLAYGRVRQILKSVSSILVKMPSPHRFLQESNIASLLATFDGFKHRFTTGQEMATMLYGVKSAIERFGSLHKCFANGMHGDQETVIPAQSEFVKELSSVFDERPRSLLPSPERGSACKRLNLFLRWMVRSDNVDPGGWDDVQASKLVIPLDVHMHRISRGLGLTERKQANLRTACEITEAFRVIEPDDPVKYDFCLTRLVIRYDAVPAGFIRACKLACE